MQMQIYNPPPTPWFKENPFWGALSGFCAFFLAGLGFALTGHPIIGRVLLALAWPWAIFGIWLAINGLMRNRKWKKVVRIAACVIVFFGATGVDWMVRPHAAPPSAEADHPIPPSVHRRRGELLVPEGHETTPVPKINSNTPIIVKPIFKNSPLFTPHRKREITITINAFYRYLKGLGFDIPSDIPPLGVKKGVLSMAGIYPGETYDAQIYLPEEYLDNPPDILNAYSMYVFRTLFGMANATEKFNMESAFLFSAYYRSSFSGKIVVNRQYASYEIEKELWNIRTKEGKQFADQAMFYTFKRWRKATDEEKDFPAFFWSRFDAGRAVVQNVPAP